MTTKENDDENLNVELETIAEIETPEISSPQEFLLNETEISTTRNEILPSSTQTSPSIKRKDGYFWSQNIDEALENSVKNTFLRAFFPCFIGPIWSVQRRKDYIALIFNANLYIILAQIVFFSIQIAFGFNFWEIGNETKENDLILIRLGAKYSYDIKGGNIWRLFSSNFLSGGIFHFILTMVVELGLFFGIARDFGVFLFPLIYFFNSFSGLLFSCIVFTSNISIGTSTAIAGVFGSSIARDICLIKKKKSDERLVNFFQWILMIIYCSLTCFSSYTDYSSVICSFIIGIFTGFLSFSWKIENKFLIITNIILFGTLMLLIELLLIIIFFFLTSTQPYETN